MGLHRAIFAMVLAVLLVVAGAAYSQQPKSDFFAQLELGAVRALPLADQHGHAKALSTSQQEEKGLRDDLDLMVQDIMSRHSIPSMTVGLLDNGKLILQKAYGHDPIYTFGENNVTNPYVLGAVSQVLTGYAALVLAGEGRLSLSDPLSKYLPTAPESWRSITIEQLLTHKSGLPELPDDAKSLAAAMEAVAGKPLRFAPGTGRFNAYSDFDILGQVIEKASGRSYMKFMHDPVFKRLKLALSGEPSLLTFRYAPPQDVRTSGQVSLTRNTGQGAVTTMSGRRADEDARLDTIRLMTRGIQEYSIPSKGLVGNVADLLKVASAIGLGTLPGVPADPGYLKLAPGWLVCRAGDETLLTAHGMVGNGFLAIADVIPNRKTGLALLARLEPGSDIVNLTQENEEILDRVLAFPIAGMTCAGQPASSEDPPDG